MSNLAIVSIILGVFIIAIRSPLILLPETTMIFYRKLTANKKRIRILGTFMAMLSFAMISSAQHSDQVAASIISIFGWFIVLIAVPFLLIFPSFYKLLAEFVFEIIDNSIILRSMGFIGTAMGIFFIYLGFSLG